MNSPNSTQRRRKRQQPTRSNSSLLNTIKSFVTAPLAWFSSNDEFEDSKGKRRRLPSPVESIAGNERTSRAKRMRMDSPPMDAEKLQTLHSRSAPYLDPPSHIFKQQRATQSTPLSTIQASSSNSTITAANTVRSTLSPLRNLGISRTMSVDPPARALKRESAMANIPAPHDVSFENMKNLPRSSAHRELSMPLMPQSTRPSFRITPQPSVPPVQRESSEPPPLSSLIINPVFVRAPSAQPSESRQHSAASQTVTLGSLADLSRSVRSPVRQHSSLLSGISQSSDTHSLRQQSPAEKALHELDIYKTPLLPSRLRLSTEASQATGIHTSSAVPDLFKSRRSQKLVLMHDEKRTNRIGAKDVDSNKAPLANETKPYAGEGGMKKLLARRKLEIEVDEDQQEDTEREEIMEDENQAGQPIKSGPSPDSSPPKADWFAVAPGVDRPLNLVSSLRIGREKRRHILRPKAKPGKSKFSAAFDEDLDDVMDDRIDEVEENTTKEEFPSKAFVFSPPPGFSLTHDPAQDSDDTKELPIPSLPFSFLKRSDATTGEAKSNPPPGLLPVGTNLTAASVSINSSSSGTTDAESMFNSSVGKGVPNFFANSKVLSKPIDVLVPPLDFKLTSVPVTAELPTSMVSDSVSTDTSITTERGPFVPIKRDEIATSVHETASSTAPSSLFVPSTPTVIDIKSASALAHATSAESVSQTMSGPKETIETTDSMSAEVSHPGESKVTFNASHNLSTTDDSLETNQPMSVGHDFMITSNKNVVNKGLNSSEATGAFLRRGPPSSFASPAGGGEPYKSLFGSTNEATASKSSFGGFNFPQTPSVADKSQDQSSSLAITTAGQAEQKKLTPVFTFGAPQPQALTPTSANLFAFGGGGTVASDVSKPFTFGTSTTGPATPLERPITPPRAQDQEVRMEESPTRDVQLNDVKPTTLGFSFSQTATSNSLFGPQTRGSATTSSPFSFGASQSNAFKEVKPNLDKAIGFPQAPSFPFGQNNKVSDVGGAIQSPTNGPFSFGSSATTFAFGAQGSNNPFGQQQASSAPSSPGTFGASFSFVTPASAFSFGASQPASPIGSNISLPPPSTSSGFGNAGFGQSAPSSPFAASSPLTPTAPSGPLFTIGSAPTATPGAPRQIKKLPMRRGGTKR